MFLEYTVLLPRPYCSDCLKKRLDRCGYRKRDRQSYGPVRGIDGASVGFGGDVRVFREDQIEIIVGGV
jgi:hypothetical protein